MKFKNAAALALAALAISSGVARAELTPLVQSFATPVPGPGGGQFFEFYLPAMNSAGVASFKGDVNVTTSNTGIFRTDGANIVSIARAGQTAPGAGLGTFSAVNSFTAMNAAGQVAMLGTLSGTNDGSTTGLFRGDGTILTRLARDKEFAPAGGNYAVGFGIPYLNSIGQAAFIANVTGTADGSTVGIYRTNGVSSGVMARDKQGAPGAGGGFYTTNFTLGTLLDSGHAIFQAALSGTNDTSNIGIFSNNGTGATAIVRNRWAAPGGGVYSSIT
ncbi:MAG TPA: choice-of-anchor tandem repeat NxxGxxAF-containing protein, partial [Tepidisphaeraceae bacterium]|nr:choice-of-anchor tandem repeat NxxGxxAF-containing protein [Tepidisphaeraceae bacterium]